MTKSLKCVISLILTAVLVTLVFSSCRNTDTYADTNLLPPIETTVPPTTQSTEEKLSGRWKVMENSVKFDENYIDYDGVLLRYINGAKETTEIDELYGFDTFEFFDDGAYKSNQINYAGTYSVTYNRIRLEGILVKTLVYTFEIHDRLLILRAGDHDEVSMSFMKVG